MSRLLEHLTPEQIALLEAIWIEMVETQIAQDEEADR